MALTTTTKVQTLLGVRAGQQLARWDALRVASEAVVEQYCKRKFESASYTEYLDGAGRRFLPLRRRPVTALTTVSLASRGTYGQGAVLNPYVALTDGVDYALHLKATSTGDTGIVVKLNGVWPEHPGYAKVNTLSWEREPGLGNVKVEYTAGFATVPEDVQMAVAMISGYMYRTARRGGMDYSERLGDHSYMIPMERIRHAPELGSARQILSRYREMPW